MNNRMLEVMRSRSELLARIAAQREQVAEAGAHWQPILELADQGVAAARFLRTHPVLFGSVVTLLLVRRRGVSGLVRMGWRVWKGYGYLAVFFAKLNRRDFSRS